MIGPVLVMLGTALLFYFFEHGHNPNVKTFGSAFRWMTTTLLEDAPPFSAETAGGNALVYVLLLSGLVLITLLVASLATKLVQIFGRTDVRKVKDRVRGHLVICGWSAKGEDILTELQLQHVEVPIVVLAPLDASPTSDTRVTFVKGHPSREEDLRRAGIDRANTAIVLADDSDPAVNPDDIDGRTLLTTLAIETIHPDVHTCVEVLRARNRRHFERANADELVVSDEITGAMLVNAALMHGLSMAVTDLLTHSFGSEFKEMAPPVAMVGMNFIDAATAVKRQHDAVLIALARPDAAFEINPAADRIVTGDDRLLIITAGTEQNPGTKPAAASAPTS